MAALLNAVDSAAALQGIESTEQRVIQHIRTAGLRKASETSLIDDIMNIRRERRRIFKDMMDCNSGVESKVKQLEYRDREMKKLVESERKEWNKRLQSCKESYSNEMENNAFQLKKKYERMLLQVTEQLENMSNTKQVESHAEIQQQAAKMTEQEVRKVTEVYENKMLRYKTALRDIVEREKRSETTMAKQAHMIEMCKQEIDKYKEEIDNIQSRNAAKDSKFMEMQVSLDFRGVIEGAITL